MAYCRNCGAEINEYALTCPKCGAQQRTEPTAPPDEGGFLWGLLGCCIPLAGLILFLVWKDTKPRTAKAGGASARWYPWGCMFCSMCWLLLSASARR